MTGNDIRRKFLDYFKNQDHRLVRSASLIPLDDPTLLFTNAGMVQFKRTFLGEEKRDYARAATSQKCVRAGGKHNDLENVGYTARHHTFFEMLGNFSFGDYFKEKAIEYAWDLLVNGYGLPAEKLWVSVYKDDDEAHGIWHERIGVPLERLVRLGEKDNFWAMGDTGPCGPCSEILIDRGAEFSCGRPDCTAGCDCDRYLEIWNLVFMQYNRDDTGTLTPLPKPSIDTGMGLERIVAVMQDVPTNFETDLILPIMQSVENLAGISLGEAFESDVAMKVIADHSRSAAFLINDGVLPSNEGRGYVLRRIMRRAIRYGRNIELTRPFLHQSVAMVFEIMREAYPELYENRAFITNVVQNEELRFSETLDNGLKLLNETLAEMQAKGRQEVPGSVIFKLYDTFGFPVDIVRDVVRDRDMRLDMDGFDAAMAAQKAQSRSTVAFTATGEAYKDFAAKGVKPEFVGYDALTCEARILLLVQDGQAVDQVAAGQEVEIVTDKTPFYGESGGQAGDSGRIRGTDVDCRVDNTLKDPTGLIIHKAKVESGTLKPDTVVRLEVDAQNRAATALNHTATHILHAALRSVLGDHVKQSGSLVTAERLRFDFTHFAQLSPAELERVETLVNDHIRLNHPVEKDEMDAETAIQSGATALFGEKYGDRVRVVTLADFSRELCGGTHTHRTGDIGLFKIVGESSVAAGVRRVEALTGAKATAFVQKAGRILNQTAHILRDKPDEVPAKVEKLLTDTRNLEKEVEKLKVKLAARSTDQGRDEVKTVNGVNVLVKKVEIENPGMLRELGDQFKSRIKSGVVVLGAVAGPKAMLIAMVSPDLTQRIKAGEIVKAIAPIVGGGGGGRPDMAQAGGGKPEKLDEALAKVYDIIGSS